MPASKYADMHLHVSLKQIVNRLGDIWYTRQFNERSDFPDRSEADEYTQSDVTTLNLGHVDLAVLALYPLEDIVDMTGVSRVIAKQVFGFRKRRVRQLRNRFPTKFKLLNHERKFVEKGPFQRGSHAFQLVRHAQQLNQHGTKLVFSLEGGHSLTGEKKPNEVGFDQEVLDNLQMVKNWTYPVFMLTLCHFQYNHLAGQAWAIPLPKVTYGLLKPVIPHLGTFGKPGISPLGKKVVEKALNRTDGKRILIDLKHASVQTRQWYYTYVRNLPDDKPPIIASHAGMSGIDTFAKQLQVNNRNPGEANVKVNGNPKYVRFNPWGINLCNDDIRNIRELGGLIGISLDQRIIGSANKSFRKLIKRTLRNAGFADNKKNWHAALFLENVFHIIQTAGNVDMWNQVCISSDNDGIIDPINCCPTARYFPQFERRLQQIAWPYYLMSSYKGQLFIQDQNQLHKRLRRVFYDNLKEFVAANWP